MDGHGKAGTLPIARQPVSGGDEPVAGAFDEGRRRALEALAVKVARVHGDHEPTLHELRDTVSALLVALEDGELPGWGPGGIDVLWERVRKLTGGYVAPAWGCGSYRRLFAELSALERESAAAR